MTISMSRRGWFAVAGLTLPVARSMASPPPETVAVWETFPMQPAEMVKEMVTVAHFSIKRVKELVEAHPALAKAAWDWGFGDWEAAVDAASHIGNREIAEYLIAKGARPTLFSAAMLGQLEVVKAFISALPGVQRCPGPHSISLLAHAKAGGAPALEVYRYLESLGDAGSPPAAPTTEEEMNALSGTYSFGSGPLDLIEIKTDRGQLSFTRTGGIARGLIHLGEHTFHPAGASAVRVRFNTTPESVTLIVHDPEPVLVATKTK